MSSLVSFISICLLGFVLGMRHALDPDHVIAVTTIVSRQASAAKAAFIGAMWGVGHTVTIFVVGTAIILFNVVIPPRIGLSMELAVGAMLILLGVLNLTGMLQSLQKRFTPGLDSEPSKSTVRGGPVREIGFYNVLRPLAVGIVHGLAGSAAVALLVMTTIRDPWKQLAYLLVFGVGTIAGMVVITAVISRPFIHTARKFSRWNQRLTVASGLLSVGFGVFVSYHIGFVDGLFTNHPNWTPH